MRIIAIACLLCGAAAAQTETPSRARQAEEARREVEKIQEQARRAQQHEVEAQARRVEEMMRALQQKTVPQVKRIFEVKYADVTALSRVLGVFGNEIRPNPELKVIAVSAPQDVINAIEDAIKRLDVPGSTPKDVDLTVHLIVASTDGAAAPPLPPDLEPVARQLRGLFAYKSFRVLDTLLLRTRSGNIASASGIVSMGGADMPYTFRVLPTTVTGEPKGALIRLNQLNLNLKVRQVPPPPSGVGIPRPTLDAGVNTEITVREGQKVVVGKTSIGGPDQALILVVGAKLMD